MSGSAGEGVDAGAMTDKGGDGGRGIERGKLHVGGRSSLVKKGKGARGEAGNGEREEMGGWMMVQIREGCGIWDQCECMCDVSKCRCSTGVRHGLL